MDRTERIRLMEQRMDRVSQWLETMTGALAHQAAIREDVCELSAYYESDRWMEDYAADEAGELPADLKRGVLSEDGLYNLLAKYEDFIQRLREIGKGGTQ